MNRKASLRGFMSQALELSDEEQLAIQDNPGWLKARAAELLQQVIESTFFTHVADGTVPQLADLTAKWRNLARDLGYNGPVLWQVQPGFTLREHAPATGLCYNKWQHLSEDAWKLQNDEPTSGCYVFWVPRLVKDSLSKTKDEQLARLAEVRKQFELPEHHLSNFGSAALLSGLILSHYKNTGRGERVPLSFQWTRTDTLHVDGHRVYLGRFGESGLDCGWDWDDRRDDYLGAFPVGVELLAA